MSDDVEMVMVPKQALRIVMGGAVAMLDARIPKIRRSKAIEGARLLAGAINELAPLIGYGEPFEITEPEPA